MDAIFEPRTRNTIHTGWWTVDDVAISGGGAIYYRLGRRKQYGAELRDERGRTVLEAFASLAMDDMARALDAYGASLAGVGGAEWDQMQALAAIGELHSFIRRFGPIGVGWGMEFAVSNREADQLKAKLEGARWRAMGIDPETVNHRTLAGLTETWTVSFWGHGPGRQTLPEVRRKSSFRGRSFAERVHLEDGGLPQDYWPRLADEQRDLLQTLDLVEAIAQGNPFECRRAVRFFLNEDTDFSIGPRGEFDPDFGRVLKGPHSTSSRARLFRLPAHQVDWVLMGKLILAGLIGRQVDFAMPLVDVSEDEGLGVGWRAASLLEVIYLELLEHVRRREKLGVGKCRNCGGRILRTRREGKTGNQWHPGCRGGRVRRWRQANPNWRSRRSDTYTPIALATSGHVRSASPSSRRR